MSDKKPEEFDCVVTARFQISGRDENGKREVAAVGDRITLGKGDYNMLRGADKVRLASEMPEDDKKAGRGRK